MRKYRYKVECYAPFVAEYPNRMYHMVCYCSAYSDSDNVINTVKQKIESGIGCGYARRGKVVGVNLERWDGKEWRRVCRSIK